MVQSIATASGHRCIAQGMAVALDHRYKAQSTATVLDHHGGSTESVLDFYGASLVAVLERPPREKHAFAAEDPNPPAEPSKMNPPPPRYHPRKGISPSHRAEPRNRTVKDSRRTIPACFLPHHNTSTHDHTSTDRTPPSSKKNRDLYYRVAS